MNAELLKSLWLQFTQYKSWLDEQALSAHTKRAYRSRLNHFLVFLATSGGSYARVLTDEQVREKAVKEYKDNLKEDLQASAATINTTLSCIDHFFRFMGMDAPKVTRVELLEGAPRALTGPEQLRLLKAIRSCKPGRNRALALMLLNAGLRAGECAALNVGDVEISSAPAVTVRSLRGNRTRIIALDEITAAAVSECLSARAVRFAESSDMALFLNPQGRRISTAGIDLVIRKLGRQAALELSAEVLRHTCLSNLLLSGNDLGVVRKFGGHKRLETTRRYRPINITICEELASEVGSEFMPDVACSDRTKMASKSPFSSL